MPTVCPAISPLRSLQEGNITTGYIFHKCTSTLINLYIWQKESNVTLKLCITSSSCKIADRLKCNSKRLLSAIHLIHWCIFQIKLSILINWHKFLSMAKICLLHTCRVVNQGERKIVWLVRAVLHQIAKTAWTPIRQWAELKAIFEKILQFWTKTTMASFQSIWNSTFQPGSQLANFKRQRQASINSASQIKLATDYIETPIFLPAYVWGRIS